jgi:hypothetical protein
MMRRPELSVVGFVHSGVEGVWLRGAGDPESRM